METLYIKINTITDIKEFNSQAAEVEGDVTLHRGRYAVDAKSLMGIFDIDPSQGVTIEYPSEAINFKNYIIKFKA